jgi:Di-haem oxidoreductase, putative peroxidase
MRKSAGLAASSFICLVTTLPCMGQRDWDPPAIKVFPDHEAAAKNPALAENMVADGDLLFRTKFNRADGAGRPAATGDSKPTPRQARNEHRFTRISGPDANSCAGCHNLPIFGGSGDFATNVFVGAHFLDPPAETISIESTNERNTTSILGAGAIEMLAREMTADLRGQREAARLQALASGRSVTANLFTKGISFGKVTVRPDGTFDQSQVEGIDDDLILKPFGVKGIAISLREFTIAALNQHHGIQAEERFGWERTGRHDFDEDGVDNEFSVGQLSALVLFQASLPPLSRKVGTDQTSTQAWNSGKKLFENTGCAYCHVPSLYLNAKQFSEPNPLNRPGTLTTGDGVGIIRFPLPTGPPGSGIEANDNGPLFVWAFTDLKRHRICDSHEPFFCNEKKRQDNVPKDEFLTPKLWDLAESAPYGHRGDCDTISAVILHHGGEATDSRQKFELLSDDQKRALIRFLLTLGAMPGPVRQLNVGKGELK